MFFEKNAVKCLSFQKKVLTLRSVLEAKLMFGEPQPQGFGK